MLSLSLLLLQLSLSLSFSLSVFFSLSLLPSLLSLSLWFIIIIITINDKFFSHHYFSWPIIFLKLNNVFQNYLNRGDGTKPLPKPLLTYCHQWVLQHSDESNCPWGTLKFNVNRIQEGAHKHAQNTKHTIKANMQAHIFWTYLSSYDILNSNELTWNDIWDINSR